MLSHGPMLEESALEFDGEDAAPTAAESFRNAKARIMTLAAIRDSAVSADLAASAARRPVPREVRSARRGALLLADALPLVSPSVRH